MLIRTAPYLICGSFVLPILFSIAQLADLVVSPFQQSGVSTAGAAMPPANAQPELISVAAVITIVFEPLPFSSHRVHQIESFVRYVTVASRRSILSVRRPRNGRGAAGVEPDAGGVDRQDAERHGDESLADANDAGHAAGEQRAEEGTQVTGRVVAG